MPSFVPGASAMSCSDYNCGTVLHGIFRIQADDDALRGQVRSPPSAQNGLLRRSATEPDMGFWADDGQVGIYRFVHRKTSKRPKPKTILRLPDLEQSKNAVLHSLAAVSSQESYGHAIDEFIGWYCSEPRLAFNRTVVLRYRFFLEQKNLAPSTINVRLAAVRRLAYEASDTGLLSPDLAAGIRRVKGAKRLGVRLGNWLNVDQSRNLLRESASDSLRGKRDRAVLALLIGCGLRRAELVGLRTGDFQVREEHCVIADLVGKGKHIRTVPVPLWAKRAVDEC